ncbi:hypothetical protein CLU96_1284 [Chryseobacterium sp. 52]|uniref:hypothetical protein n=1 Tax=Chryseobacterium sp. 52 TaxID=2035213 RepID=UPI000C18F7D4|nr:hypothetical protein [Chryseobacterium sp. 52]PIF44340.1 hypothetical protein CLU96_1284 [Chryseobacterium sp. 52]
MLVSDTQILKLPQILKDEGRINLIKEFYEDTGIPKAWFSNVKNQEKRGRAFHFTAGQIQVILKVYNIDANWIFGIGTNVYRSGNKRLEKSL